MSEQEDTLDFATTDLDLYSVLQLSKEASPSEIKRAYYKLALLYHPDKVRVEVEVEAAKLKFQQIGFAYSVLSDPKRKEYYDRTGSTEESLFDDLEGKDWSAYFQELFTGITEESIREFSDKYKGSKEEYDDLVLAYETHKGDMDLILGSVLLAEVEDEDRLRKILMTAIEKGDIKAYKRFTKVDEKARTRRRQAAAKEAKEAEELARELGLDKKLKRKAKENDEDSLKALIQQRSSQRMNQLVDSLEAKYAKKETKKGNKKRKTVTQEPTEEEFAALQKKILSRK